MIRITDFLYINPAQIVAVEVFETNSTRAVMEITLLNGSKFMAAFPTKDARDECARRLLG